MIFPHFEALGEFYLRRKNDVGSMGNKTHHTDKVSVYVSFS